MELPLNPAATLGQLRVEQDAVRLFKRSEVRSVCDEIERMYAADSNAQYAEMPALARAAAEAGVFSLATVAVNEDPGNPAIFQFLMPPHRWMGIDVPDARFGVDNPDNVYRMSPIDGGAKYRIQGRFYSGRPADFSLSVLTEWFGEKGANRTLGFLGLDDLQVEDDGRFEITLDNSSADGRPNHLPLFPEAKWLIIRDTLGDWTTQQASMLEIAALGRIASKKASDAERAARTGELTRAILPYFMRNIQHGIYQRGECNRIMPPIMAGANGGLVSQVARNGYYHLGEDEAVVITVDRKGARYLGLQLSDLWTVSYNYWERLSSLNHCEATADADGLYRFVVSARDPGVLNWLDGSGYRTGAVTLRWQGLPPGTVADESMAHGQVVKLPALRDALPGGTRFIDVGERAQQRLKRASGFERRTAW